MAAAQEWVAGSSAADTSTEGVIGASWRVFKFSAPETSLQFDLQVYPSISDTGALSGNRRFQPDSQAYRRLDGGGDRSYTRITTTVPL